MYTIGHGCYCGILELFIIIKCKVYILASNIVYYTKNYIECNVSELEDPRYRATSIVLLEVAVEIKRTTRYQN